MRDRKIQPLDESSSRQIWVGWGSGIVCFALAFLIGGIFAPYLLLFIGLTVALRGHLPQLFAKHIDAQIIAGTPYRREESPEAWGVALVACLVLAATTTWIHERIAPQKPDLVQTILSAIDKLRTQPTPSPQPPASPTNNPTPHRGAKLIYATPKPPDQAEIGLLISNIADPVVSIENVSSTLLRDPYYRIVLWRLSKRNSDPLESAVHLQGSWIRGHERVGPIRLIPETQPPVVAGEEFFGYIILSCPECADTRSFHVGLKIGDKGWYSEMQVGMFPWDTGNFVKNGLKWPVNEMPSLGEDKKEIYDRPRY